MPATGKSVSAPLPRADTEAANPKHPISEVTDLLEVRLKQLVTLGVVQEKLAHPLVALVGTLHGAAGSDPNHVVAHYIEHRLHVAARIASAPSKNSSTFSCDIAYSRSPTASRASSRSANHSTRSTLPPRKVATVQ